MAARTSAILGLLKKTLQGLPFRVGARCLAGEERGCILSNGEGESIFFFFFFSPSTETKPADPAETLDSQRVQSERLTLKQHLSDCGRVHGEKHRYAQHCFAGAVNSSASVR